MSHLNDDVLLEAGGPEGGLADAQRSVKVWRLSRRRLRSHRQSAIKKVERQSLMQRRIDNTQDDREPRVIVSRRILDIQALAWVNICMSAKSLKIVRRTETR